MRQHAAMLQYNTKETWKFSKSKQTKSSLGTIPVFHLVGVFNASICLIFKCVAWLYWDMHMSVCRGRRDIRLRISVHDFWIHGIIWLCRLTTFYLCENTFQDTLLLELLLLEELDDEWLLLLICGVEWLKYSSIYYMSIWESTHECEFVYVDAWWYVYECVSQSIQMPTFVCVSCVYMAWAQTLTQVYAYTRTITYMYTLTLIDTCIHACTYKHRSLKHIHVCGHVCISIHMCMDDTCLCMHAQTHLHANTHIQTQHVIVHVKSHVPTWCAPWTTNTSKSLTLMMSWKSLKRMNWMRRSCCYCCLMMKKNLKIRHILYMACLQLYLVSQNKNLWKPLHLPWQPEKMIWMQHHSLPA